MDLKLQREMPLEALLLHPSAAVAGSLWTCLAVLAAAFGLWRFRSVAVAAKSDDTRLRGGHPAQDPATAECNLGQTRLQSPLPRPQPEARAPPTSAPEAPSPPHSAASDEGSCASFARKGTVFEARGCYSEVEVEDEDEDEDEDCRGGDADEERDQESEEEQLQKRKWAGDGGLIAGGGVCWSERWTGDLGWYLYQDVAALNGSVVRLWEEERRLAVSRVTRRLPQLAG